MDYKSLSIEELIRKCAQNQDSDAWIEFDRRFRRLIGGGVIAVGRKYVKNPHDYAGDLINDTYVKLMKNNRSLLSRFQSQHENSFLGYLRATAASVSHDFFRHHCRAPLVELDEAVDHPQRCRTECGGSRSEVELAAGLG